MKNFTLLFIFLISASANAQDNDVRDTSRYYSHSYFGFSYQQQSFPGLNNRVTKYYPRPVPESSFGLVFGGKTAWDRMVVQGDIGLSLGMNGKHNEGRTFTFLGNAGVDAGVFLTPGMVRLYPFAGLGVDVAVVNASVSNKSIHFDSLLSNPVTRVMTEPVNFTAVFFSWRAGLAMDIGSKKHRDATYVFGLRAGYKSSFHRSSWSFNSNRGFIDAPSDRLEQWYASVVFYGGLDYMSKKKKK